MSTPPDTSSPAALSSRPDARTLKVEDLVPIVLAGQLRIPSFQRGIKWDASDALALIDSIDRGYPIGTLLLWQRPAKQEQLRHGTVVIDAPERPDALWVVDGQQRVLSLTRIFAGAGFPEEPFAAFYDLREGKFKRLARRDSPAPHDLPLTELLDSARLVDWFFAHPEVTPHRQAAIQLGKRLREYLVPAYVVTTSDERTVREIFRRANNTGKRMEDSEIFNALYGAEGPAPASLRDVARSLDDLAFGPIDEATLHNMLLATRGTDRTPRLSPAYDQVATIAYVNTSDVLALPFHGSQRFEDVSLAGFRRLASKLRRDPDALARWVTADVARVMDAWASQRQRFPLSLEVRHALDRHHQRLRATPGSLLAP